MSACDTLPPLFRERLTELYSEKQCDQILAAFSSYSLPSFRVNTLKTSREKLEAMLMQQDFLIEPVVWYPDAFILKTKSVRELTATEAYKKGLLYIQNLSSMLPVLILDPQPGEAILDLAAAPGSKTTQIATLMHNTGELTANDLSYKRLFKLKENLKQMGVTNAKVLNLPGESFWKHLPEYFDRTLIDVPCSMEGRFRCDDPKTSQDWSTKKIKQLSKLQKYLLRSAIAATKVGGTIVYSSCTLSPEENEEVIEWVVKKTGNAISVEPITTPHVPFVPGLSTWRKKTFAHAAHTARVIPSTTMEGFFVTKLHKLESTLPR